MTWFVAKNGHQKDICYNKFGLCINYMNHSRFNSQHKLRGSMQAPKEKENLHCDLLELLQLNLIME